MSSRIERARSLVAELLIVFFGVLIALAADAWLQARVDVERTTSYLGGISADMDAAAGQLDPTMVRMQAELERLSELLELIRSDAALSDTLVVSTWFNGGTADVPMGTMNALLATGDLELVGDDVLRNTLVREHATLEAELASAALGSAKISNNVDRRIVAEEEAKNELGLSSGLALPLQAARRSPELVAAHRIHLGAMTIRLGQFRRMRQSVETVRVEVKRVLDRE